MARTQPEVPASDRLSTEEALGRLDGESYVRLVGELLERGQWTVESVRDDAPGHVDLCLAHDWPEERRALARVGLPGIQGEVSETDVRHFVRTVQGAEVDEGMLVVPGTAPESVRRRAETFDVDVIDGDELTRRVNDRGAHDLLAEYGDHPVERVEPLVDRAPDPIARALVRYDAVDRLRGATAALLPPDPTADDLARLTFTGLRIGMLLAAVTFLSSVLAPSGSALFWLLLGGFLCLTYGAVLPLLAADTYLVRRFEDAEWTPAWWPLASAVFVPLLFAVGALYWYRRRTRTPSGRDAAW